jgi:hypothetical protein
LDRSIQVKKTVDEWKSSPDVVDDPEVIVSMDSHQSNYSNDHEYFDEIASDDATSNFDEIEVLESCYMQINDDENHVLHLSVVRINGVRCYVSSELGKGIQELKGSSTFTNARIPDKCKKLIKGPNLQRLKKCLRSDIKIGSRTSSLWVVSAK